MVVGLEESRLSSPPATHSSWGGTMSTDRSEQLGSTCRAETSPQLWKVLRSRTAACSVTYIIKSLEVPYPVISSH